MIQSFLLKRLFFAWCMATLFIASSHCMDPYHNAAIGNKYFEPKNKELSTAVKNSALIYLKSKEGKTTPVPYHFLEEKFRKKIDLLNKERDNKMVILDCQLFDHDVLKLAADIIIFQAGQQLVSLNESFSLEKLRTLIVKNDKKESIAKAQNLLHALMFFKIGNSVFGDVFNECKQVTHCKKKELLFLQEDLIAEIEEENSYTLRSEDRKFKPKRAPGAMNRSQQVLYSQMNLSPSMQRSMAFSLVKQQAQENPYVSVINPYIIDKTSWQDLEIICGSGSAKDTYFTKSVDHTCCQVARVLLYTMLLQPTDKIAEIEENKKIISLFLDHEDRFKVLDGIFQDFFSKSENENGLLSFFHDRRDYFKSHVDRSLMPDFLPESIGRYFNSNEYAMSIWNGKDKARLWITSKITKPIDLLHEQVPWISPVSNQFQNISIYLPFEEVNNFSPYKASLLVAQAVAQNKAFTTYLPNSMVLLLANEAAAISSDVIMCLMDKGHRENILARLDIINCLYEKLYILSQFIKTVKQINAEIANIPGLKDHLPCLKVFELIKESPVRGLDFINQEFTNPDDFDQFINKLGSGIFTKKDSSWTSTRFGRVIATYYLVSLHKEKLFDIYMAVAELDVYLSLVRLYTAHKDTDTSFCLVQAVQSDAPRLEFQDLWNPMLGKKAVKNSIHLGVDKTPKDLIITGPNEGGKSTLLRSIIFAILMAKMGLCPAKAAAFTPFCSIRAYLNITDDAAHDRSLFRVSTERANELLSSAKKVHPGGHSLVIFDELYNGTKPKVGETLAYGTLKYLNQMEKFPKNICIASTHYPCVQQIREEKESNFSYWRVCDASDGKNNRYKIVPGIYTGFNGFEVAQDAKVNPEVIQFAQSLFSQNNTGEFNGTMLYLGALEEVQTFNSFMVRLKNNDSAVLRFFHTVVLKAPYYRMLFTIASKHGVTNKELINHTDPLGRTILHYFALRDSKDVELLAFLLSNGADLDIKDEKGMRPADYALSDDIKNKLKA